MFVPVNGIKVLIRYAQGNSSNLILPESSAGSLCEQLGPRSGPKLDGPDLDSN